MKIDAAVIEEQGVTFVVVLVQPIALKLPERLSQIRKVVSSAPEFSKLPVIFAAQLTGGKMRFQGREDIVDFLGSINAKLIPWTRYEFRS